MSLTHSERFRLILIVIALIVSIFFLPQISLLYDRAESLLSASPILGPLLYSLLMIGAILIAPIPASPLAIIAGQIFGPWCGMFYTLIAATIGALLAFLIARFLLGEIARNHLRNHSWYKKMQSVPENKIAYLVAVTRLMPQVSFDLISYVAGLTPIRPSRFAFATFIGMIPIVFLLSFFGVFLKPYQEIMLIVLLLLFLLYALLMIKRQKDK